MSSMVLHARESFDDQFGAGAIGRRLRNGYRRPDAQRTIPPPLSLQGTVHTPGVPNDRWQRLARNVCSALVALAAVIGIGLGIDWRDLTSRP
jgi:hypothetical protein